MNLEGIERFLISRPLIVAGEAAVRRIGESGDECFVLWSGIVDGTDFRVLASHVPRQTAIHFDSGVCVRVDGPELHRLNVWLFEAGQQLGVQVHSHPTDAYHSDTDDAFPIVTAPGGLSIVVPWFGLESWFAPGTAAYRLQLPGRWAEVPDDEFRRLVEISD